MSSIRTREELHEMPADALTVHDLEPQLPVCVIESGRVAVQGIIEKPANDDYDESRGGWYGATIRVNGKVERFGVYDNNLSCDSDGLRPVGVFTVRAAAKPDDHRVLLRDLYDLTGYHEQSVALALGISDACKTLIE